MAKAMLSTVDNPWNPHTNYREWLAFDIGPSSIPHITCNEYLGRIARITDDMTEEEEDEEVERAIDEIVRIDPFGIYIKVKKGQKMPKIDEKSIK